VTWGNLGGGKYDKSLGMTMRCMSGPERAGGDLRGQGPGEPLRPSRTSAAEMEIKERQKATNSGTTSREKGGTQGEQDLRTRTTEKKRPTPTQQGRSAATHDDCSWAMSVRKGGRGKGKDKDNRHHSITSNICKKEGGNRVRGEKPRIIEMKPPHNLGSGGGDKGKLWQKRRWGEQKRLQKSRRHIAD